MVDSNWPPWSVAVCTTSPDNGDLGISEAEAHEGVAACTDVETAGGISGTEQTRGVAKTEADIETSICINTKDGTLISSVDAYTVTEFDGVIALFIPEVSSSSGSPLETMFEKLKVSLPVHPRNLHLNHQPKWNH